MKKIPLSSKNKCKNHQLGLFAVVDDFDYEYLNQWRWQVKIAAGTMYAVRTDYTNGKILIHMHRDILSANASKLLVDHKDGNGLNNRRLNIRVATRSQNNANKNPNKNSTSKYLGVSWKSGANKWRTHMSCNKTAYHVGYFNTQKEAALAYNKRASELHGEFANLNKV